MEGAKINGQAQWTTNCSYPIKRKNITAIDILKMAISVIKFSLRVRNISQGWYLGFRPIFRT